MRGPFYIPFVDFTPTLESWKFILFYPYENLRVRFFNSAVVGLSSTLLTLLLGGMAVYGLTRFRLRLPWKGPGNRAIMAAILATRILPPAAVAIPIYMMATYTGTLDTRFALVVTYTAANLPVAVWLLQPIFGVRATEQEEAALLDGASHLQIFFLDLCADGGSKCCRRGLADFHPVLERIPVGSLPRSRPGHDTAAVDGGPDVDEGGAGGRRSRGIGPPLCRSSPHDRARAGLRGARATCPWPRGAMEQKG